MEEYVYVRQYVDDLDWTKPTEAVKGLFDTRQCKLGTPYIHEARFYKTLERAQEACSRHQKPRKVKLILVEEN